MSAPETSPLDRLNAMDDAIFRAYSILFAVDAAEMIVRLPAEKEGQTHHSAGVALVQEAQAILREALNIRRDGERAL